MFVAIADDRGRVRSKRATHFEGASFEPPLVRETMPTIALVDDNPDIVNALEEALRERHYHVVSYRSGDDALRQLEQGEPPALIALDLLMPQMDGWTFRVRQRASSKLRDVPVLVMTACSSPQAEAIDADAYLRKPMTIERFCTVVEQTLAKSERRRLAARTMELERLRSLGVLTASIAHEINTPLTYVRGMLELAARDCGRVLAGESPHPLLRVVHERVESALHGTGEISELVRSVLLFARAEEPAAVGGDLAHALENAVRLASAQVKPRARLEIDLGVLPLVRGDEARLGQVFLNLLMNAAQAIAPGAPDTNVISIQGRRQGANVVVEVSDTGSGVAAEHMARIFDPFFTTKPPGQGTGIGLSHTKQVIEQLGGTITVRPGITRGTIFTITLPIASSSDA